MKVGVLMGGRSPEREISLKTGENILKALINSGYDAVGIDAKGNVVDEIKKHKIDVAFIALHGPYGEDGTIQGLLEFLDIPYTGSGVLASALAMDKVMTKKILKASGIPTPPYFSFHKRLLDTKEGIEKIHSLKEKSGIDIPLIVKPSVGGSTLGTTIVKDERELISAYREAGKYHSEILVEKFISGVEITVGVLGGDEPFPLPVIEIIAEGGFYNYTTKYQPGMSTHIIPARIPEHTYKKSQEIALKVFETVGCYGMGRVDFIVERDNLWVLEINTIPGMTETSLLPEAASKVGIDFETLIIKQINYAIKRQNQKVKEVPI